MTLRAFCGLLQKVGSSARRFRSSRRADAVSQSKMPPQQRQGLADGVGVLLGVGAHGGLLQMCKSLSDRNVTASI
jgi:hypothetical protein